MPRRPLTFADRADIAVGILAGKTDRDIGAMIDRDHTVVWRERRRNTTKTRGYKPVHADGQAQRRRQRKQARLLDTNSVLRERVLADLGRSRTPRQIAGRLRQEAAGATVTRMTNSPDACGHTVSHEAIYRWIYAMPRGELAKAGVYLQSKRTHRKTRKPLGERTGGRIIGMTSIDARPPEANDRRVPGAWEGDLIIGKNGKTAIATLVERHSRYVILLGLPHGKASTGVADILIDCFNGLPDHLKGSLTWDQGTEMARHAQITLAANIAIYFAHAHSPWERPSNENTNRLIREYLPKGIDLPSHQPYLDSIAEELNERPRQTLDFYTPREVFIKLLNDNVASTS